MMLQYLDVSFLIFCHHVSRYYVIFPLVVDHVQQAMLHSQVILIFMSDEYCSSSVCSMEFEIATKIVCKPIGEENFYDDCFRRLTF